MATGDLSGILPGVQTAQAVGTPPLQPLSAFAPPSSFPQAAQIPDATVRAQANAVSAAAKKYGVDFQVLWSIFGAESSYGHGGSNWFGLVAVKRSGTFAGDADLAAKTLKGLLDQNGGDYDKALRQYSGGAYDRKHLSDLWASTGNPLHALAKSLKGLLDSLDKGPSISLPNPLSWADALGKFIGDLLDPHTWVKIAEVVGGGLLVLAALKGLTGIDVPAGAARMVPV